MTPYYLEVTKTLNKSEFYVYRHIELNHNICEVEEVQERGIYGLFFEIHKWRDKRTERHWASDCVGPEKGYFQAESSDS